jgi:hypothetical protein
LHPLTFLEIELRLPDELGIRRAEAEVRETFAQVDEPRAREIERRRGTLLVEILGRERTEVIFKRSRRSAAVCPNATLVATSASPATMILSSPVMSPPCGECGRAVRPRSSAKTVTQRT